MNLLLHKGKPNIPAIIWIYFGNSFEERLGKYAEVAKLIETTQRKLLLHIGVMFMLSYYHNQLRSSQRLLIQWLPFMFVQTSQEQVIIGP